MKHRINMLFEGSAARKGCGAGLRRPPRGALD